MVGLGEKYEEVEAVLADLRAAGCNALTVGQYLPPSPAHYKLVRYVTPQEFQEYQRLAERIGFSSVASGPFVRSSFNAAEAYEKMIMKSAA